MAKYEIKEELDGAGNKKYSVYELRKYFGIVVWREYVDSHLNSIESCEISIKKHEHKKQWPKTVKEVDSENL